MRKIAVIGLGRFGMALAKRLSVSGAQVIAIDRDPSLVNIIKDDVDLAVCADATDQVALMSQDVDKVDVCVVSIGEDFEAALLTTVLVRNLEVSEIICRAQSEYHAEIFLKIGAHRVIQPELDAGLNLARQLANPHLVDFIRLADEFMLLEFAAPTAFVGKSIRTLALRNRYDVNLVVIRRRVEDSEAETPEAPKKYVTVVPKPDDQIEKEDLLVVVGSEVAVAKLPRE